MVRAFSSVQGRRAVRLEELQAAVLGHAMPVSYALEPDCLDVPYLCT